MKKNCLKIEDIANWFLNKEKMTHKKLQKLCYYSVAWGYALLNCSIVTNPDFQAWIYGPVSPDLYQKYKGNAWIPLEPDKATIDLPLDENIEELLESIWITYGDESGNSLEALSNSEIPWINARKSCNPDERCGNLINPKDMKDYYLSIYLGDEQ